MGKTRRSLILVATTGLIGLTATCSDFDQILDTTEPVLLHVTIEQKGMWPSEIRLGETVGLEVLVRDRDSQQEIKSAPGMQVSWQAGGSAISLSGTSGLSTGATGANPGSATPTVTVSGGPIQQATYSDHTFAVVAAGVEIVEPGDTMLDALGDTLTFVAKGLDVDGVAVDNTGLEWRRGSGTAAVELQSASGDTVKVAVVASGTDSVFVTSPQCQAMAPYVCEVMVQVDVQPVPVAMAAAQDTFDIDAIGDATTVDVEFYDRNGFPFTGIASTFTLVDPADTAIIQLDGATGQATALAAGEAEVAINNTVGDDTAVVRVFQIVDATGLDTSPLTLEGIGSTDSLFLAPTDANGNALQRMPAVTWSSSSSGTVAVAPNLTDSLRAQVTVASFGDAWIYADVEGVVDSVMVTATGVVASVNVSPPEVTITQLTNRPTVTAAAFDSLGNQIPNAPLAWSIGDEAVATVEQDVNDATRATVTPVASGSTWVTATSGAFSDSALITVDIITTFTCDAGGGTVHDAGGGTYWVTSSETWTKSGSPHFVQNGDAVVDGDGVVLTIEAGALVCVDYGSIYTQNGGRIEAIGSSSDRILFTATNASLGDRWGSLFVQGAPGDSSRLDYVVMQNLWSPVSSADQHPLIITNSLFSQSGEGVTLSAPGSRISDSRVEGIDNVGVYIANHTRIENTTISGTGWHGLATQNWEDTVAIVNVTVENAGTNQAQEPAGTPAAVALQDARFDEMTPITVSGSRLPLEGTIDAIFRLYPSPSDMDVLTDNVNRAVQLRCGYIDNNNDDGTDPTSVTLRGDFDWRVICGVAFGGSTLVTIEPGATVKFITDTNYNGFDSQDLEFYGDARLVAEGTDVDPITFTSLEAGGEWNRLSFAGGNNASDTTRFKHVLIENSYDGVQTNNGAHLVMDSSRIRNTGHRALTLWGSEGGLGQAGGQGAARIRNTVIDTVRTNEFDGYGAITMYSNTVLENVTVRGTAGRGVVHMNGDHGGDAPTINGLLIEGAQGVGLWAGQDTLAAASGVQVTGGASKPAYLNLHNLALIAPREADQANLTGNDQDTLLITGGSGNGTGVKGVVDVFGSFTAVDTLDVSPSLPWRVSGTPTVDSAAVLVLQPNSHISLTEYQGIEFRAGRLVSLATSAEPAVLTAADPSTPWGSLHFYDNPQDTSYVRNVVLEYGGNQGSWPYAAVRSENAHPVVVDSTTIRQTQARAVEFMASGSRITASVVDTTLTGGWSAVDFLADTTSADGLLIRHVAGDGIHVDTDSVSLANVRIEEAQGEYGIQATNGTLSLASNIRVTGGAMYPAWLSIQNLQQMDTDSLLGNARDTLVVAGGTARGKVDVFGNPTEVDTLVVRKAVPWRITGWVDFDSASVFMPDPGATVTLDDGVRLTFREGRLEAVGTSTDSITFMASDPQNPWGGLYFTGTAPDTSVLDYARVDLAASDNNYPYAAIFSEGDHPVVVKHTRIWRSKNRAVDLGAVGSRLQSVVVDTTLGYFGNHNSAVELSTGVRVDTLLIRSPYGESGPTQYGGLYIGGDSVDLNQVRIEDAIGVGLVAVDGWSVGQVTGLRITGGNSYPLWASIDNLNRIAPTAAAQDSLLGNARDTLIVAGGRLKGVLDGFGNPTQIDTLTVRADIPWRVPNSFTFDSASVWMVEAGGTVSFGGNVRVTFDSGQLLAQGTSTDSVRFQAVSPADKWAGFQFYGDGPVDTSRVSYARITDSGSTGYWPYTAIYTDARNPVVVENTLIKRAGGRFADLRAPNTRFVNVLADTAVNANGFTSHFFVAADSITLDTVTVRGTGSTAVYVNGADSLIFRGLRILGAGGDGLIMDSNVNFRELSGLRITGGKRRPAAVAINVARWLDPDSLLGNTADSLVIMGSSLADDTVHVTPAIPWALESGTGVTVNAGGVMVVDSGGVVALGGNAWMNFDGGLLFSNGTPSSPARFTSHDGQIWAYLNFTGTPGDTSRIRNTRIEYGGNGSSAAITTGSSAPVIVDSSLVRQSGGRALEFFAAGSQFNYSVVDTTNNASYPAVEFHASGAMRGSTIRDGAGIGLRIIGDGVSVDSTEITLSGAQGAVIAAGVDATSITFWNNNLVSNTGVGVDNQDGSTTLTAIENWWGDAAGAAAGDGFTGLVDVSSPLGAAVTIPSQKPGG